MQGCFKLFLFEVAERLSMWFLDFQVVRQSNKKSSAFLAFLVYTICQNGLVYICVQCIQTRQYIIYFIKLLILIISKSLCIKVDERYHGILILASLYFIFCFFFISSCIISLCCLITCVCFSHVCFNCAVDE